MTPDGRAFGGLLRLWQGRRVQAGCVSSTMDAMLAGKDDNRPGFNEKMVSLAQAESVSAESSVLVLLRILEPDLDLPPSPSQDQKRLEQVEQMHRELYQAMRAASPDDPAMGVCPPPTLSG